MRRLVFPLLLCMAVIASACSESGGVTAQQSDSQASTTGGSTSPESTAPVASAPDATTPSSTDPTDQSPSTTTSPVEPIDWQPYIEGVDVGHLEVPIDYENPTGGSFDLVLVRHRADPAKRIGSLLVNPGGPGFSGAQMALQVDGYFSEDLIESFDIIGWDPRGAGESTPAIDCTDDYDHFFMGTDITPDDDAERQQIIDLAKEFEDACVQKNADIIQHVGTNDSARDMDRIRQALGEETISYFGFSYGSELGATWATLFPTTVRAAVLDGAIDPNTDLLQGDLDQSKGFEEAITAFLAHCSNTSDCVFNNGGDAEGAFDALMQSLDENPIPSVAGRPDIGRGEALTGVAEGMYRQAFWPVVEQALADAQNGDGAGLLNLFDAYYHRAVDGSHDNNLEAFQTIHCMDQSQRLTIAEEDATVAEFMAVAPRFRPGTTGTYGCTFFPPPVSPRVPITGIGAGPIVVVGTTGDPATPLAGSEKMARALEGGVLLVVDGSDHTGYGLNQCSYDNVDGYLIDLSVPPDGTRCD